MNIKEWTALELLLLGYVFPPVCIGLVIYLVIHGILIRKATNNESYSICGDV